MFKDKTNGLMRFSPSDLMAFMDSHFQTWMNRFAVEFPEDPIIKSKDVDDDMKVLLQEHGYKHEDQYVSTIMKMVPNSSKLPDKLSNNEKYLLTKKLMQDGKDYIFQARLEKDNFAGFADVLIKKEGPSLLGNHYYEPWDTKLSRSMKASYAIQLCCYGEMLELIQGDIANLGGGIILGDNSEQSLNLTNYKYYYQSLKKAFLEQQKTFNEKEIPDPAKYANHGVWGEYAAEILDQRDHLSLVARITRNQIKILEQNGINTVQELSVFKKKRIPKLNDEILERLVDQAGLQVESRGLDKPKYRVLPPTPQHPRTGLALLAPHSPNDIFFDMEGYPMVQGGLEYLFGASYLNKNGQLDFKDFWAHNADEEKKAFEDFIDWAYGVWAKDKSMHIYHYANYERAAINKLMSRYGTREKEVDDLYTHGVLIDLYEIVRNGLRVGEPAYSIKNIEHLYRDARASAVTNASSSVVFYNKWLQIPDGKTWKDSKTLNDIREYNKDDCDSTQGLTQFLREVQKDAGITWIKPVILEDEDDKARDRITAASILRDKMLAKFPDEEAMETLAWVVEWQRRENKPKAWQKFARLGMTTVELYEDADCLAQIKINADKEQITSRTKRYTGNFNPEQETKLKVEGNCIFQEDTNQKRSGLEIVEIDYEKGTIVLDTTADLPASINLIPSEFINPDPVRTAVEDVVQSVFEGRPKSKALMDFMYHKRPDLQGSNKGPIVDSSKDILDEALRVAKEMQKTTLCIQGPPGAGKTHTAATMILGLLKEGKRIGITSNSHKAVVCLIEKVLEIHKKEPLNILKIGGDEEEIFQDDRMTWVEGMSKVRNEIADNNLICGSAWAFSNPRMAQNLDYLFIDEASQISVCFLVGLSRSTDNLILMGDQQQLAMPAQGVHPGKSGLSCLEYFLKDKSTIPEDLGIFLPQTWRMHPEVNKVVSEMVYESRLQTAAHTVNRKLLKDNGKVKLIDLEAGIVFLKVDHTGNGQTSPEEIEAIKKVITELLGRTMTDKEGALGDKVREEDILIVAPYNLHVNNLKKALSGKVKVGTVDKFQGQEAPISILSLCTSSFEDSGSSRGIGFLFSKNRMNVAISRSKCISIIVGCPDLINTPVRTLEQMELLNFFCRIVSCN
jgi:predicted RecB family nuclease